jgi:hypothetical protein
VDWPGETKRLRPAKRDSLRVYPLDPKDSPVPPSIEGQHVIVTQGAYTGQRGVVSKITGPKCNVRLRGGTSCTLNKESVHVIDSMLPSAVTSTAVPAAAASAAAAATVNGGGDDGSHAAIDEVPQVRALL